MMKILFLAKNRDATSYYRCDVPAKYLAKAGYEVRLDLVDVDRRHPGSGVKEQDINWADVIIFQRPVSDFHRRLIEKIKIVRPDKVVIGEYDDDYSAVPSWNPGYSFIKSHDGDWQSIIPLYDGVITSTEPLKKAIGRYTQAPIRVIKNAIDFEVFDQLAPTKGVVLEAKAVEGDQLKTLYKVTGEEFNALMENKVVVAWAGSRFHFVDLDWLTEKRRGGASSSYLAKIALNDPEVVFLFVGYCQGNVVRNIPTNQIFTCGGAPGVTRFYQLLKALKMDICLAPVDPCEFNESKSALKIMEAMAIGAFPIASDFDTYEDDIGQGLLAGYGKNEWRDVIKQGIKMVRDGSAKAIVEQHSRLVRDVNNAERRPQEYIEFLGTLLAQKRGSS